MPRQPAVNDLFLLAFATRRDGPAAAQIRTAAELLSDASEAQAKAVLASIRKVILKWYCPLPPCPIAAPCASLRFPPGMNRVGLLCLVRP
jgi:hypothetical protein